MCEECQARNECLADTKPILKLYVVEMPVDACINCHNIVSPVTTGDEWRCREKRNEAMEMKVVPHENLGQGKFPDWCPLSNITMEEWDKRVRSR